jgi:hypothetical protein
MQFSLHYIIYLKKNRMYTYLWIKGVCPCRRHVITVVQKTLTLPTNVRSKTESDRKINVSR